MRVCAAFVAVLGGCASPAALSNLPRQASSPATRNAGSWMAADAKRSNLLYVSDYASNDVDAYSYPGGKLRGVLKGILKGFVLESGLCSDAAGNVFIPDNSNSTVLVYAHGSTKRVRTLLDRNQYPYTCAVDRSGNLAVVDYESVSGGGGISIYARARGRPKRYDYAFVYKFYFAAYDPSGNLFADASYDVPSEPFAFLELPAGGNALQSIELHRTVRSPGGVAWAGNDVVVGDSRRPVLHRFSIAGSAGQEVGSTRLEGGKSIAQFFILNGTVVGANFDGGSVAFWKYPKGGAAYARIGGLREPFGVVLSRAPR